MEPVELLVYDLSQGMAKTMSMSLVGKQIDGIWHTAVVVFGTEYCFGQGVEELVPGMAPYGHPVHRIPMGHTQIPKDVFQEYMENMKSIWTADKYNLFDNNCNSFSEEVCQFLVGKSIPSHITNLPKEFLSTPMGQMLKPMIEGMYSRGRVTALSNENLAAASSAQLATSNGNVSSQVSTVQLASNFQSIDTALKKHKCVAIFFTSATCGPCRMIAPEFESLTANAQSSGYDFVGLKVDTSIAQDAAMMYHITATPTFMFFHKGDRISEFQGADSHELKTNFDLLIYTAYPPSPHQKLRLDTIHSVASGDAVELRVSSNLEKIFEKLGAVCGEAKCSIDLSKLNGLKDWLKKANYTSVDLPANWYEYPVKLLLELPVSCLFPLLDILRLVLLNPTAKSHPKIKETLANLIVRVLQAENVPTPTLVMLLRFLTNMFNPKAISNEKNFGLYSERKLPGISTSLREQMVVLVVESLLSEKPVIRQTSALLAFNLAWGSTQVRKFLNQKAWEYNENYVLEMIAALCSGYQYEIECIELEDDETLYWILGAIGLWLAYSTPPIVDLVKVVGLPEMLGKAVPVKNRKRQTAIANLTKEILSILNA